MRAEIIFVDDERHIRDAVRQTLEIESYRVATYASASDALAEIDNTFAGVIITDINMPQMNGMAFLDALLRIDADFQVIMLTGHGDISTAVQAMRQGAYDFLEKPFSSQHLLDTLQRAFDKRKLVLENRDLRQELTFQTQPGPRLLGHSDAMQQVRRILAHQRKRQSDLLISGENGTGKKLCAQFLQPDDQCFHSLDCANHNSQQVIALLETLSEQRVAVPRDGAQSPPNDALCEVQIDSHHAFAREPRRAALVYLAHVDKLEDPDLLDQWLASQPSRPRIVASTRRSLLWMQQYGHPGLVTKLGEVALTLPPLSEREDDIDLLFNNFCRNAASRYGITLPRLTAAERDQLRAHQWHGNVQQLRGVAERFVLLGQGLMLDAPQSSHSHGNTLTDLLSQFERSVLTDALSRHGGRLKDVQSELGLARKTLYDKLKKHALDKAGFKS
uniref:sigma-54-dependent transcriptional regulator n=1 Tax=Thaumasiovibrio occultus TaxID=1891184 RepID=UPI00131B665D|nr:sigma-54 dependent transcriptional regulator [Thaumasiovibrio occultus]